MSDLGKRPLIREGEFEDKKAGAAGGGGEGTAKIKAAASVVAIVVAAVFLMAYFGVFSGGGPEAVPQEMRIENIATPQELDEWREDYEDYIKYIEEEEIPTSGA